MNVVAQEKQKILQEQLLALGLKHHAVLHHNLSFDTLYQHELNPELEGYERGKLTTLGAVAVDTGVYTGRSPKDKYIVEDSHSLAEIWWKKEGSDNQPMSQQTFNHLKTLCQKQLEGKVLYVMDGFCGANPATRLKVRLITEVAWMAHFFKNMFIRPTDAELRTFTPDWTILNACKTRCENYQQYHMNSETFIAFHLSERLTLIGGTWYGGEIKKGIFSVMNYFLPLQGIGSFHCSANQGNSGDTALFFGLSGTGKTTLSTDPLRQLIGDDEHGWDDEGVFNLEGGCYAKTIDLSAQNEPDIYRAIRRNALLENVTVSQEGVVDFASREKTENTRVSYPIDHIDNIVKPISKGRHPKRVIFLTCDAYGVLPPVSCLTPDQAMYQFLSGYTAKIAGTERGIKEPTACFSAAFGQAFLLLHPTRYAEILGKKMQQHGTHAYLLNTGWSGGAYGVGRRISIQNSRAIIHAILSGEIDHAPMITMPYFNFKVPTVLKNVDSQILIPRKTWADQEAYDQNLKQLVTRFIEHFKMFENSALGQQIKKAGPVPLNHLKR